MKPILFNTEMVRAILDGRKTVTRRIVKTQHKDACGFYVTTRKSDGAFMGVYEYDENESMFDNPLKPPYEVNDILYVRETWAVNPRPNIYGRFYYKANKWAIAPEGTKWRPSIHMPAEAARIFLKVTGVRVVRLQDMDREDFWDEGIESYCDMCTVEWRCSNCTDQAEDDFKELWDSTIKKDQLQYYGWDANPYVWVIKFETIDRETALKEGLA